MGRAALIICTGMAVVLGLIQVSVLGGQVSMSMLNVEYVNQTQARNYAISSMEMGIKEIMDDFSWRPDPQPWIVTINGDSSRVHVDDAMSHPGELNSRQVRVRANTDLGNRSAFSYAIIETDVIFPEIPGALGFYTDAVLNINGMAFEFVGEDTNPNGTAGPEESLPGVAADSTIYDELLDNLNNQQQGQVEEFGYEEKELDDEMLQGYIDLYMEEADPFDPSAPGNLGSPDSPRITVLNEDYTAQDKSGAGILIVRSGVEFTAKGDFVFEGLVIVQGKLDLRGNVTIYGSMLFGGDSELEIPDDDDGGYFSGNVKVNYSSMALANVSSRLSYRFDVDRVITQIYD